MKPFLFVFLFLCAFSVQAQNEMPVKPFRALSLQFNNGFSVRDHYNTTLMRPQQSAHLYGRGLSLNFHWGNEQGWTHRLYTQFSASGGFRDSNGDKRSFLAGTLGYEAQRSILRNWNDKLHPYVSFGLRGESGGVLLTDGGTSTFQSGFFGATASAGAGIRWDITQKLFLDAGISADLFSVRSRMGDYPATIGTFDLGRAFTSRLGIGFRF